MRSSHRLLCLALLLLGASAATADSWAPPTPRVYANKWGSHGFKVVPSEKGFAGPATGVLFTLGEDGKEKVAWSKELVNMPHRALVSDRGQVVTIDSYANLGFKHSLVIYDAMGKVLADYALEDLLTKEELEKVLRSVSSRHWAGSTTFEFTPDCKQLSVTLKTGRTIKVDLATGKLVKDQ